MRPAWVSSVSCQTFSFNLILGKYGGFLVKNKNRINVAVLAAGIFLTNTILANTINIDVDGFNNSNGQVLIYLHNKSTSFPSDSENAIINRIVQIQNKTAKVKIENVVSGLYAVAIVHDENSDGKLETNFVGIPKEGVGASNNARGNFGPPSFDDASFKLENDTNLMITVHY